MMRIYFSHCLMFPFCTEHVQCTIIEIDGTVSPRYTNTQVSNSVTGNILYWSPKRTSAFVHKRLTIGMLHIIERGSMQRFFSSLVEIGCNGRISC